MSKFKVTTLSHPLEATRVWVYAPLVLYQVPYQNKLSQSITERLPVVGWIIVRFSVTTLSHPTVFVVVKLYDPEVL